MAQPGKSGNDAARRKKANIRLALLLALLAMAIYGGFILSYM